jgi:hypothetical protein
MMEIDLGMGNPAPSLEFSASSRGTSSANIPRATTQMLFASVGVTFGVDLVVSASTISDQGSILIVDSTSGVAARADYDAQAGTLAFQILGSQNGSPMGAPLGMFHTIKFTVDGSYNANWVLDGVSTPAVSAFYPAGVIGSPVRLGLEATFAASPAPVATPTLHFDNVLVTSP